MKLYYTNSSPYARKVRAHVRYLGCSEIDEIFAHPFQQENLIRDYNPLGKIPVLQLDDQYLMDSETIIAFLNTKYSNSYDFSLLELRCLAMCQGLMDAAVNLRVETVRKLESDWWTRRLKMSIESSLIALNSECSADLLHSTNSHLPIALVCAFDYLEFRHQEWASELLNCELRKVLSGWTLKPYLTEIPFTD